MPTVISNRPASSVSRKRVWTTGRKIMGNLLPTLFALPPAGYGIWWMALHSDIGGRGFWIFASSPIVGWLAMNFLGLFQNGELKQELLVLFRSIRGKPPEARYFVGVATPKYTSLLDPHEDIGYLMLFRDRLEFVGDHLHFTIYKESIAGIQFRMNPHTLVGLGRWVAIDGEMDGHPIRLQIELRENATLLGNMMKSGDFKRQIEAWLTQKGPESSDPGPIDSRRRKS
jgi:hypothetical protein